MTTTTTRLIAALATSVLIASACAESNLPLTATSTTGVEPTTDPAGGVDRQAATYTAESWTIPASRGGNGSPTDEKTENDCFQGVATTDQMICFVLRNNTIRLTSVPNVTAKFPLTVARYLAANGNESLGGRQSLDHDGSMAATSSQRWDCGADCVGRLTPNPFLNSAIMQFQSWSNLRGAKIRLVVSSEVDPMGGVQRGAEVDFDSPKWSNTNLSECYNGDYFRCREVSIPSSGGRSKPVYEISTRPMEVSVNFVGSTNYTLVRQGYPITSGFMVDPAIESANAFRIKPGERVRYGGYRSVGDQAVASFKATYVVGNADGVTDRTTCEGGAIRVLGCGTQIFIEVSLDKDGNATSSNRCTAINLTSQTRFSCKAPAITGTNDGVKLVDVDISDVPIR
jgi:hypothetical protein